MPGRGDIMIRTKLAKKVLTKKDQRHLTEDAGIRSMTAFERTRKIQGEMRLSDGREPCFHCRSIALKLGIED